MKKAVSVSQLNMYIKSLLSGDRHLSDILVRGEISNFKLHYSGHMYFTLKDDKASVRCVMFAAYTKNMVFNPADGMQITAAGYISVYEKSGQYQLYVSSMLDEGEGALFVKFEKLKQKLKAEGMFSDDFKKPIPYLPEGIGVVTSATGSVIKDIVNVLNRRFPKYNLTLFPSHVQGEGAYKEIAAGIRYFNSEKSVDVIIIARGGGSIEDLWPFNEEYLARAIFESKIPVISAVGHETDFTIADFVSDKRAPTPSAAAEIVVPELEGIMMFLKDSKNRLNKGISGIVVNKEIRLQALKDRPVMARPEEIFNTASQTVDRISEKMHSAYRDNILNKEHSFRKTVAKIELLSPMGTIARGYSVTQDRDEHVITSIANVRKGVELTTLIIDGTIISKVVDTEGNDEK